MSRLEFLECSSCAVRHDGDVAQTVCQACGRPLLARYSLSDDLPSLAAVLSRPASQNRLHELGPTSAGANTKTLGEGATPLIRAERVGASVDLANLWVKDEGQNPTGSFKSRGMAAALGRAAELGISRVCLPTAGNAGGAAAAYGALHGIEVHVAAPDSTPSAILAEIRELGAELRTIPGTIADAGRLIAKDAAEHGWFSLATLKEPYRIEGKKVMGFELLYDLGRLPDAIVYPTGGGTGLIGMAKAFDEMEALGWIDARRPRMISVQTEGCAPIVRAFEQGLPEAPVWENPGLTRAFGLRVPGALGDRLMLSILRATHGIAVAVSEDELSDGTDSLRRGLGLHACEEGGACLAAAARLRREGRLHEEDLVVIFNTGHGLKYR